MKDSGLFVILFLVFWMVSMSNEMHEDEQKPEPTVERAIEHCPRCGSEERELRMMVHPETEAEKLVCEPGECISCDHPWHNVEVDDES